jgi:tetratricopeptide (TPR) repeat protein
MRLLALGISLTVDPQGTGDTMKPTSTALLLVLAAGTFMAAPAAAQAQPAQSDAPAASPQAAEGKIVISKGASKAIQELQAAVTAKDVANIPAKLAAAQAVAKTPEDRFAIARLQYLAADASKDNAGRAAALEALLASGKVPAEQVPAFTLDLGNAYKAGNQLDRAASTFERAIAADPNNLDAIGALAETRISQGRSADAVQLIRNAMAARTASGQKGDEGWYKRAVAVAYKDKLPDTMAVARDWVAAYPSPTSWKDTIAIYRNLSQPDDSQLLDLFRLERAVGALSSEADFQTYASLATDKGYANEAKAVLEEGSAAGKIDRNAPKFKTITTAIASRLATDRTGVAGAAAAGMSASNARAALANGDVLYGASQFAKAAEVYRAALGKSGADAGLINLHLGAALAQQGDKAGARAALNAVTGANADLAKLWLTYLTTRA